MRRTGTALILTVLMVLASAFPVLAQTGWVSGDEKYWLDGSGAAVTGWQEIDGKWYYFQEDNTMATDMTIDSYYVGKDGAWVVGK